MRKLIVPLIVVVSLLGAEAATRRVEGGVPEPLTWDTHFSQDKAAQIEQLGETVDVIFAGSSVAQANIDPPVFTELTPGFSTGYNAALPSLTPRVWRQFLLDTIYPDHCPSLVVLAVDIRQFNDNKPGSDDQRGRYLWSRGRSEAIGEEDFWQEAERWLESQSALFRMRARLREPDKVVAWIWDIGEVGDWRNTNLSPEGRYQSNDHRTYEASEERLESQRNGAFRDLAMGGRETDALRGMVEDAHAHGAAVVLVEMPTMKTHLAGALPNGAEDQARFTEILEGVAEEYDVPFIRLAEMDDEPVYYSDDYHMNWIGAEHLSSLLAEKIGALELEPGPGSCNSG